MGDEQESETGMYQYGARYMDAKLGRFVSVEPILNQYLNGKPNEDVYKNINIDIYR